MVTPLTSLIGIDTASSGTPGGNMGPISDAVSSRDVGDNGGTVGTSLTTVTPSSVTVKVCRGLIPHSDVKSVSLLVV